MTTSKRKYPESDYGNLGSTYTIIGSGSALLSPTFTISTDGVTITARDQNGTIISSNANARVVFNAVMTAAISGGIIFIKKGTYTLDTTGGVYLSLPSSNLWICGEGMSTIINQNGMYFKASNKNNLIFSDFKLINGYGIECDANGGTYGNWVFKNIWVYNTLNHSISGYPYGGISIKALGAGGVASGIRVIDCFFDQCLGWGFACTGDTGKHVERMIIDRCIFYYCGYGSTFESGCDLGEDTDIWDTIVSNCIFDTNNESGLYMEDNTTKYRILIENCLSLNNGTIKGSPTFGAGYLITGGTTIRNCVSKGNIRGYELKGGTVGSIIMDTCSDIGSTISFSFKGGATAPEYLGANGKIIGHNLLSEDATNMIIEATAALNMDIEMTTIGGTSTGGNNNIKLGSVSYPVSDSRFKLKMINPAASDRAIQMNGCDNIIIEGEIITAQVTGVYIDTCTDISLKNLRVDSTGTNAIRISGTNSTTQPILINDVIIESTNGTMTNGINNVGTAGAVICRKETIKIKDFSGASYTGCVFINNWGSISVADGGTIAHLCHKTPVKVNANTVTSGEFVSITAKGATTFTVAIKKHDGTAGTTANVYWHACTED